MILQEKDFARNWVAMDCPVSSAARYKLPALESVTGQPFVCVRQNFLLHLVLRSEIALSLIHHLSKSSFYTSIKRYKWVKKDLAQ
jgi:hypothetical protein